MRVCPRWPQIKRIDASHQRGAACSWRTSWCCSPTAIFNVDQILCTVTLAALNNSTTSIHSHHLWLQKVWSQMEGLKSWRLWAPCPVSLCSLGGVLGSCLQNRRAEMDEKVLMEPTLGQHETARSRLDTKGQKEDLMFLYVSLWTPEERSGGLGSSSKTWTKAAVRSWYWTWTWNSTGLLSYFIISERFIRRNST